MREESRQLKVSAINAAASSSLILAVYCVRPDWLSRAYHDHYVKTIANALSINASLSWVARFLEKALPSPVSLQHSA